MLVYAVTIFLSAFLLFQVQPLIAKFILPWFGGSAAVWSAALLFFRPENIELADGKAIAGNGSNCATGTVERITFLGNAADVILRCGEITLRARIHPARVPSTGRQVKFRVAPESCIVFPA